MYVLITSLVVKLMLFIVFPYLYGHLVPASVWTFIPAMNGIKLLYLIQLHMYSQTFDV